MMSCEGAGDVYFMEKKTALMSAGYAISECFYDPMHFPEKPLESSSISFSYNMMSVHALVTCVQCMFPGKVAMNFGAKCTHGDPILDPMIPSLDRKQ